MTVTETAYAKINLALHVRRRRDDGYHELDTIFAFADDGDVLNVERGDRLTLAIDGPFGEGLSVGADNLVLQAARAMQAHFDVKAGASIHLTKILPVAAGLGGGSADAAAAARALNKLWDLDADEAALIKAIGHLGADIASCLLSRTIRGEGVGDIFRPVDGRSLTDMPLLIANPRLTFPTGPVFSVWDGNDLGALDEADVMTSAKAGRNDLQPGAIGLCPLIEKGLGILHGNGEWLCRMSGAGASIFAIYHDVVTRDEAASAFERALPDWWTMKAKLL